MEVETTMFRDACDRFLPCFVVLIVGFVGSGCPRPPAEEPEDAGSEADAVDAGLGGGDDDAVTDSGEVDEEVGDDVDAADDAQGDVVTGPEFLCESCASDDECGDADDECVSLFADEQVCGTACDLTEKEPCPDGYRCFSQEREADTGQCIPDELTCEDRCADADCGEGEVCDPISGECRARLELCDTECTADKVCGDGPEDRCIPVPETDGERICATGCNPESDETECPINYQCAPLRPDVAPEEGICFPMDGTCVDRCSDKDCGEGSNCQRRTGQCVESTYGSCEQGCEGDVECGGQQDRCLTLEEGGAGTCLFDCSDSEDECPSGYLCRQVPNSTTNVCLPSNGRCDACRDTDCGDDETCDPTSGECVDIPTDCTETGCPDGEVCSPTDKKCVEVGRECSGNSWAGDCDNFVTGCTTRRSGTTGRCARICDSNADCAENRECLETNLDSFCLGDDNGGPETCGTLHATSTDVGAPCDSDFDCPGSAPDCVGGDTVDGFCSRGCTRDSDCPSSHTCREGPDGDRVCLSPQCACAVQPSLANQSVGGLTSALQEVDLDQCDLVVDPEAAGELEDLRSNPLARQDGARELQLPLLGHAGTRDRAAAIDDVGSDPQSAAVAGGALDGEAIEPSSSSYSFGDSQAKITQAVARLSRVAGGSPDVSKLESKAESVPTAFQDVAAPIVMAVADAVEARDTALADAGWDTTDRQAAFAGAPYLFLPGTSTQEGRAPDLSDPAVREQYRKFPTAELTRASGEMLRAIAEATSDLSNRTDWTGFTYVAETPAGKVVLGDATDTTYSKGEYGGDIAVVVDAGGADTYRVPVGANQSPSNGVAVNVDLGGKDTYTYPKEGDSNIDEEGSGYLISDGDGRKPGQSLVQGNGPVALSTTGRQGAARIGIAAALDFGSADDVYESLRMSQGSSVFGVGTLYDAGGDDTYEAEALAQGAALGGVGVLLDTQGADSYRMWYAGQGFGTAAGAGLLAERGGADEYVGVPGRPDDDRFAVLYYSPADRGASNRNLVQGASAGLAAGPDEPGLGGGRGMLHDLAGDDQYRAATYAQGTGSFRGIGALIERGGADSYQARAFMQGVGRLFGGGILDDAGGGDTSNEASSFRRNAQGFGRSFGWGIYVDQSGDDVRHYGSPGGGVARNAGIGLAVDGGGVDEHILGSSTGWGFAENNASSAPVADAPTTGVFVDVGGDGDTYDSSHDSSAGIGDDAVWFSPDSPTSLTKGVGLDE